jgi:hypothetical protein
MKSQDPLPVDHTLDEEHLRPASSLTGDRTEGVTLGDKPPSQSSAALHETLVPPETGAPPAAAPSELDGTLLPTDEGPLTQQPPRERTALANSGMEPLLASSAPAMSPSQRLLDRQASPVVPTPASGETGFPPVAGYTVLKVLGRGGMGVVFQAKQPGLNRLVALKMFLSG